MVPSDFKKQKSRCLRSLSSKNPDFDEVYQAKIQILTKFIDPIAPTLGLFPHRESLPVGGVSPLGESPRRGSLPVGRVYNPDLQKRESLCQGAITRAPETPDPRSGNIQKFHKFRKFQKFRKFHKFHKFQKFRIGFRYLAEPSGAPLWNRAARAF